MDDLFPDDKYDKMCEREDRHALLGSIAMLIILCALVVFMLLPNLPKEISSNTPYQADAVIYSLDREDNGYVAKISITNDLGTFYYYVDLTKQEFMSYKESQPVRVEIIGNKCKILN